MSTVYRIGDVVQLLSSSASDPKLVIHGFTQKGSIDKYDPQVRFGTDDIEYISSDIIRFAICTYYNPIKGIFDKVVLSLDEVKKFENQTSG